MFRRIHNLFYGIEQMIQQVGANMALLYLGLFLIIMTAFKVGTAYFGSYFMIPIRMGVVRDLRNQLYRKIVSLPIGFFSEERKGDILENLALGRYHFSKAMHGEYVLRHKYLK